MLKLSDVPVRPLVAASILSADFSRMGEECADVLGKGADLLHIDVMDGHFVPNLTMGGDMVKGLRKRFADVYLDAHLMVEEPERFVEGFAEAGANHFSFHLEVCEPMRRGGVDAGKMIERIHGLGMEAGMVVNPPTGVEGLGPWLGELDMVLVMSVNPGRSGQKFMPEVLGKLRWLKERVGKGTRLEVDGGVNAETVGQAVGAGAEVLVTASALFGTADRAEVIRRLHEAGR